MMDLDKCLKTHGYMASDNESDNERDSFDEIYNRHKPPPVPYEEFKHRIVNIYAADTETQATSTSAVSVNNDRRNIHAPLVATLNATRQQTHVNDDIVPQFTGNTTHRYDESAPSHLQQQQQKQQHQQNRQHYGQSVAVAQPKTPTHNKNRNKQKPQQSHKPPKNPPKVTQKQEHNPVPATDYTARYREWKRKQLASAEQQLGTISLNVSTQHQQPPYQELVNTVNKPQSRNGRRIRRQQQQQQDDEDNGCCCCVS